MRRYLRFVSHKRKARARDFQCRAGETFLSWYEFSDGLDLVRLQESNPTPEGSFRAIWCVSLDVLSKLDLHPKPNVVPGPFGDHHCSSECPDDSQAQQLAKEARCVRLYVSRKAR